MSVRTEISELDEPIMTTIKRDLLSFITKIRYVLFPFSNEQKVKELRNWDLFGPLLISVSLTVLMILKGNLSNSDSIIAANFLILFAGSLIVTLNAKLCGVQYSLFFYVSVLGYCLAPFIIAAALNFFLGFLLTRFFVLLITAVCYVWALKSCSVFFALTIQKSRKNMVLYPVCLYYLFFGWFIVLE